MIKVHQTAVLIEVQYRNLCFKSFSMKINEKTKYLFVLNKYPKWTKMKTFTPSLIYLVTLVKNLTSLRTEENKKGNKKITKDTVLLAIRKVIKTTADCPCFITCGSKVKVGTYRCYGRCLTGCLHCKVRRDQIFSTILEFRKRVLDGKKGCQKNAESECV